MAELFEYPPPTTDDALKNTEDMYRHLVRLCEQLNQSMGQINQKIEEGRGMATKKELEAVRDLAMKNRKSILDLQSAE